MSDCMFQNIRIGGDPGANREKVLELMEELASEEIQESSDLYCDCSEACEDSFDDLKKFLRSVDLPYNHFLEGKWDHDGSIIWWRPGMEDELLSVATQSEDQTVRISDLAELAESGMTLADAVKELTIPPLPAWVMMTENVPACD